MKSLFIFFVSFIIFTGCKDGDTEKIGLEGSSIHFTVPGNIEPVSLIHLEDGYHLFFTGSPEGKMRGKEAMRQAISKDLLTWSEGRPIAFPASAGNALLGAIVVDSNNVSRLSKNEKTPLIAVLTTGKGADSSSEGISRIPMLTYSVDDGNSWTTAPGPVDFPAAFIHNPQNAGISWHRPTQRWIMTVALANQVEFHSSPDLHHWKLESVVGTNYFPDEVKWRRAVLFSSKDEKEWALLADIKKSGDGVAGGTVYFTGTFDGHTFENHSANLHWLDYGRDVYASIICGNANGSSIHFSWNYDGKVTTMTVPRAVQFDKQGVETSLLSQPVAVLQKQYRKEIALEPITVRFKEHDLQLKPDIKTPCLVEFTFKTSNIQKGSFPTKFGIRFQNRSQQQFAFGYDRFGYYYLTNAGHTSTLKKEPWEELAKMPFLHQDSVMTFKILLHSNLVECFAEGGRLVMSGVYSTVEPLRELRLFAENGNIDLVEGKIIELGDQIESK